MFITYSVSVIHGNLFSIHTIPSTFWLYFFIWNVIHLTQQPFQIKSITQRNCNRSGPPLANDIATNRPAILSVSDTLDIMHKVFAVWRAMISSIIVA